MLCGGDFSLNDKAAANLLEQYGVQASRILKGRGCILCETEQGLCALKEYTGREEKLALMDELQGMASDIVKTDTLVRNKDGGFMVRDIDGSCYILKRQIDGRECSCRDKDDILKAFATLANLHLKLSGVQPDYDMAVPFFGDELEKHTRECRRVKNYLSRLKKKTDFERRLLREYDYFLNKAEAVTELARSESKREYEAYVNSNGLYCHGDYQYHNIVFAKRGINAVGVVNFEHFSHDAGVRDFYLLFRKISEKNDWSMRMGEEMLNAYQSKRQFTPIEWRALRLRLAYPEKFWKIINFYYNSRKSWVSGRNYEKLETLLRLERPKEQMLERLF